MSGRVPAARCGSSTRLSVKAIAQVIDGLAADPRPAGVAALTGHRPYLRVRSGDYRVIYCVDDGARVVTVAAVGHRRELYRSFDL
jgi:mRNA interferase RelE/StbE